MNTENKGMRADAVTAPRNNWEKKAILHEGEWWSMAMGYWTDENGTRPVLAQRWNGSAGEKGNPTSSGHPTWFILPDETYGLYFGSEFIPEEKRLEVITFLLSKPPFPSINIKK